MPTFFVAELHSGLFETPQLIKPARISLGWRFFAHCAEDDISTCGLLTNDFLNLSVNTRKAFIALCNFIFEAGKTGKPWNSIIQDGKIFHPIHDFQVERIKNGKKTLEKCVVFQFKRKKTDIRVLFVNSGGQKHAFITQAFEKDTQKTPQSEKTKAEENAKAFFASLDSGEIELIALQKCHTLDDQVFK